MSNNPETQPAPEDGRPEAGDNRIDYSDIPETSERDWKGAVRGRFHKPGKRILVAHVDDDLLSWLERDNGDVQERLNAILRQAIEDSQITASK